MPFDNIISRSDVQALIPEEVSNIMLTNLNAQSAALELFRRTQVPTNQTRFPVLAALPTAYFVNGDTGQKQTTEMNWANKYLNIEELAAIVPIPENVLDDASFDVWGQVRPMLEQAISRKLDAAIFFGTNKPASWPNAIVTDATAAGNVRARGTATVAQGGIAEDMNQLMATIEADGFDVSGFAGERRYRSILRGARDANGQRLLDVSNSSLDGSPIRFVMEGLWPTASGTAELFAGDFSEGIIGVRRDFTWKVLDQAVITDDAGAIVYNLAQQDMVALRVTFRVGFQVSNRITYSNLDAATRYPFGVMTRP